MNARAPMLTAAAAVLAAACALLPARAAAQGTAAIGVDAQVSSTALSVAQMSDLIFGNVVPGVPATINPKTSTSAGEWVIHGNRNAEVAVTLTLPTQVSTGFWTMPVTYSNTSGCWRVQNTVNCNQYDPTTTLIQRLRNNNPPNNTLYVKIGGTVTPSATQHAGVYLGNITLSVAYTGN